MDVGFEKFRDAIDDAVKRKFAAAAARYSISEDEIKDELNKSIEKHLFRAGNNPSPAEIRRFIDSLHAEDFCLIVACRNGNENAWNELFTRFQPVIKSAARRIFPDAGKAEELAGSIWSELYGLKGDSTGRIIGKLAYYSGRGSLSGWLRAVVAQMAVDRFRENKKMVQIVDDHTDDGGASGIEANIAAKNPDPEREILEKRAAEDVNSAISFAISSLSAEDRLFLKMYYFDDLKLKEIGKILGFHEATASRRLVRIQTEIRRTAEKVLQSQFGWNEHEIRTKISDTVQRLDPNLDKLLAGAVILAMLQGIVT